MGALADSRSGMVAERAAATGLVMAKPQSVDRSATLTEYRVSDEPGSEASLALLGSSLSLCILDHSRRTAGALPYRQVLMLSLDHHE